MPMILEGRLIQKIAVIDDDPTVRSSYVEALQDLDVEALEVDGLSGNASAAWDAVLKGCDAVLTDLVLKRSGYSPFNGGVIAVEGGRRNIPTILCTSYTDVNQELLRFERRHVAAILPQAQFELDPFKEGLRRSICELDGNFLPERRPWRTQVEIVDIDPDRSYVWVIVMGRSPNEKIKVYTSELPNVLQNRIDIGVITHARVNTGAESAKDLYFDEWEFQ